MQRLAEQATLLKVRPAGPDEAPFRAAGREGFREGSPTPQRLPGQVRRNAPQKRWCFDALYTHIASFSHLTWKASETKLWFRGSGH